MSLVGCRRVEKEDALEKSAEPTNEASQSVEVWDWEEASQNAMLVYRGEGADFIGDWKDIYNKNVKMEITSNDNKLFEIIIDWTENLEKNTRWVLSGTYNADVDGIFYTGVKIEQKREESEVTEEVIYSDGTGLFWFGEDGKLYWANDIELPGNDCAFVNINLDVDYGNIVVESMPAIFVDISETIPDGTYPVSFSQEDLIEQNGNYELTVVLYNYDYYDETDIHSIEIGNRIRALGTEAKIERLEWWEEINRLEINGGYEVGGISLMLDEAIKGFYRTYNINEQPDYYPVGILSLPLAQEFVMIDLLNDVWFDDTMDYDMLPESITENEGEFNAYNTSIVVKKGKIIELLREWIPGL